MPDVTKPSTTGKPTKSRMWLVTGKLVDAIWRPSWILLHVEIDEAEAIAINAAIREMVDKLVPGAVTDVESPVIRVGEKLCLKAWGRSVSTIRNKDGEDLVSVKVGAKIALKVALSPYQDPVRGWRVTAFPGRIDVIKPAPKPKAIKGKSALAEDRARKVVERAAAKVGLKTDQQPDKALTQAPTLPKPVKSPRSKPAPAAVIIPFPASATKH
jgi:hypothetical protein